MKHTIDYEKPTPYSRPKYKGINAKLNQFRLYFTYRKQVNTIVSHYRFQDQNNYIFLDVGCGSGEFIYHLSDFIPANLLMGLELDYRLVNEAQERCVKAKIYEGSAEFFPFPDSSINCITSFHNIEHIYQPESFISESYRCLKKNGLLVLATPNPESLAARSLKEKWHSFQLVDHVSLKSPKEWRELFVSYGFSVISEGTTFFTGFPIVSKTPLQVINYALLSIFGSLPWNYGEAYHAVFRK
ncbi:class I SAM-dependent methyltransferase [Tolypothrix sp. PCC 7910]|uniref:class I SAM-dependent methyltransferase n=1 Tax=Tolypothrix sp. PCC 7910 TaxID=2099387 RepID=UPI0014279BD3|nr:class I SAM-dependent methyltransferase [Tolypothrix sp. PCC 7910]QIR39571.1 class I SAM-dependent methyltransferase [Tolypothrix sp. PCC 7910]